MQTKNSTFLNHYCKYELIILFVYFRHKNNIKKFDRASPRIFNFFDLARLINLHEDLLPRLLFLLSNYYHFYFHNYYLLLLDLPPRLTLIKQALFFILANFSASNMPLVSGVNGQITITKSLRSNSSSIVTNSASNSSAKISKNNAIK